MGSFEQLMEDALQVKDIPGAVLIAANRDGTFLYEKAFGACSLKDASNPDPMTIDATMWLASCTKFMTTIAAMQCVERGLLKLDDDVTGILPELKDIRVLTGFEGGEDGKEKAVLVESKKTITLRHLLTHSSGLSYDFFDPTLLRYQATLGKAPGMNSKGPLQQAYLFPLLFEPGESWSYGVGIDWAGFMVERVNDNISLEEYVQKNIWGPLCASSFTFWPKKKPETISKLADITVREEATVQDPNGKLVYSDDRIWDMDALGCSGGAGGFGSVVDYHKMLHSIMADDGKLLKRAAIDEMFKPQLTEASRDAMMAALSVPKVDQAMSCLPAGIELDYGLSGTLLLEDVEGGRRKGTLQWGGYPNQHWFVDREQGLVGIYGSQLAPPGDKKTNALFTAWEQELYRLNRGGKE